MIIILIIGFITLIYYVGSINVNSLYILNTSITKYNIIARELHCDDLETVIQRQALNKSIILFCTDSGYINLFLNAYYASQLKEYRNLVVTCFDRHCYRTLSDLKIPVAILDIANNNSINTQTASTWGTKAFQNKVQWKLVMLMRALDLNIKVLYVDSDIILLKKPFAYLNSIQGYDLIAQKDTTICSGFMYLHPTSKTKALIKKAAILRPKLKNAGDQKAILTAVREFPTIKTFLLPIELFSSGENFFNTHSYYWDPINSTQIMIHNNYVIGTNNKLFRFKELKMYKLDVNGEYSNPNGKYLTIENWSKVYAISLNYRK